MYLTKLLLLAACLLASCNLIPKGALRLTDGRPLTILTIDLFNQRPSRFSKGPSLQGDWLFRRKRLQLIDAGLIEVRPDIIAFQELMEREGSPAESDRKILSVGALDGYHWLFDETASFEDTAEIEALALAFNASIVEREESFSSELVVLGEGGKAQLATVKMGSDKVLLVNVMLPDVLDDDLDNYYLVLFNAITKKLREDGICDRRLVIGGFLPAKSVWPNYQRFLVELSLKDTAQGFCTEAERCFTESRDNQLQLSLKPSAFDRHVDRLFVHESAAVADSRVVLNQMAVDARAEQFGLEEFWPTPRFGWQSKISLPRCRL